VVREATRGVPRGRRRQPPAVHSRGQRAASPEAAPSRFEGPK
jgi:hypothetical protein